VRQLTTDNNVSVSFDSFGFSVTDFQTGIPLMRCDSIGDHYPVTSPSNFSDLTSGIWHSRLSHPMFLFCSLFIKISFLVVNIWILSMFVILVCLANMLSCLLIYPEMLL